MQRAIGETDRRRAKQVEYNTLHNITPKGVTKRVKDMIDGVYDIQEERTNRKAAQQKARYEAMSEKQLTAHLKKLEKEMYECAKNLEFERAAEIRDELRKIKEKLFVDPAQA